MKIKSATKVVVSAFGIMCLYILRSLVGRFGAKDHILPSQVRYGKTSYIDKRCTQAESKMICINLPPSVAGLVLKF